MKGFLSTLRLSTRSGFTLIEVLVVVILIGIVVALSAPDYLKFRQKIDLNNSITLLQSGLQEAYSLARSRSRHYEIHGSNGDSFYELRLCDDYNCTTSTVVIDSDGNPNQQELEGDTIINNTDFVIRFLAPHGQMEIVTPSGVDAMTLTLDNKGLTQDVQIYALSGLITTDISTP